MWLRLTSTTSPVIAGYQGDQQEEGHVYGTGAWSARIPGEDTGRRASSASSKKSLPVFSGGNPDYRDSNEVDERNGHIVLDLETEGATNQEFFPATLKNPGDWDDGVVSPVAVEHENDRLLAGLLFRIRCVLGILNEDDMIRNSPGKAGNPLVHSCGNDLLLIQLQFPTPNKLCAARIPPERPPILDGTGTVLVKETMAARRCPGGESGKLGVGRRESRVGIAQSRCIKRGSRGS